VTIYKKKKQRIKELLLRRSCISVYTYVIPAHKHYTAADPPKNCLVNVKKLPENCHFFFKIAIFPNNNCLKITFFESPLFF